MASPPNGPFTYQQPPKDKTPGSTFATSCSNVSRAATASFLHAKSSTASSKTSPLQSTTTNSKPSALSLTTLAKLKQGTVTSWAFSQRSANTLPEIPPSVPTFHP